MKVNKIEKNREEFKHSYIYIFSYIKVRKRPRSVLVQRRVVRSLFSSTFVKPREVVIPAICAPSQFSKNLHYNESVVPTERLGKHERERGSRRSCVKTFVLFFSSSLYSSYASSSLLRLKLHDLLPVRIMWLLAILRKPLIVTDNSLDSTDLGSISASRTVNTCAQRCVFQRTRTTFSLSLSLALIS